MNWWQRLFRRRALDAQLESELRFHVEEHAAELVRQGVAPEDARRQARMDVGPLTQIKEYCRDARGTRWLEDLARDFGLAVRQLRQSPAFTMVAVVSLALAIGANTAILTLIDAAILRPIPVKNLDTLRLLTWREEWGGWVAPNVGGVSPTFGYGYELRMTPDNGLMHPYFAPPFYDLFRQKGTSFQALFGFREIGGLAAVVNGNAEPVNCVLVSGEFYRGLEVAPVVGRAIGPEDDTANAGSQVVMISYDYWTRRFARDPAAVGKTILLNGLPVKIIGVNPQYFTGVEPGARFEIWAPLHLPAEAYGRSALDPGFWQVSIMGRLKPGVSDAQAQAEMDALFQAQVDAQFLAGRFGEFLKDRAKRPRFILQPAARGLDYLTQRYDRTLLALWGLAGMVLLIACVNVANLLLAKSAARRREVSLRLAIGAGRWRIARQLLTEGLLLAVAAGIVGVGIGYALRNALPALLTTRWRPSPFDVSLDWRILAATATIALLTGLLFSLAPIFQAGRVEVNDALKDGARGTAGLSKLRLGRGLVVLQISLSMLLLAAAGLFVRTFVTLRTMDLGFRPEGVLVFTLDLPRLLFADEQVGPLLGRLQERMAVIPGVRSASFTESREGTVVGTSHWKQDQRMESYARATTVSGAFFETMGIPILRGRPIDRRDESKGPQAAVVNRRFAEHFFGSENPVGETFVGRGHDVYQVVGVCGDWRFENLRDEMRPAFYTPVTAQAAIRRVTFQVSAVGSSARVGKAIREAASEVDANLVIIDLRTEVEQIEDGLAQEKLLASLASVFGGLALLLAAIGIYGVMAYTVTRRTNEIGIRAALGARPRALAWMVMRETLIVATVGILIAMPAVWALGPILNRFVAPGWYDGFVYGQRVNDTATLLGALIVLVITATVAGYLPARRAAGVDPMTALRHE